MIDLLKYKTGSVLDAVKITRRMIRLNSIPEKLWNEINNYGCYYLAISGFFVGKAFDVDLKETAQILFKIADYLEWLYSANEHHYYKLYDELKK